MSVPINADDANMVGSVFHNVNMTGVSFGDVNMSKARLRHITFAGSQFSDVDLSNVVLTGCKVDSMVVDGIQMKDLIAAYRKGK